MGAYTGTLNSVSKSAKDNVELVVRPSPVNHHARLTDDGLTQWHPAFLDLGATLEDCAEAYQQFCRRHKPKQKTDISRSAWGSKLLNGLMPKQAKQKISPGQKKLWENAQVSERTKVDEVAKKIIETNQYKAERIRDQQTP